MKFVIDKEMLKRSNGAHLSEPTVEVDQQERSLQLHYKPTTNRAIYNVYDLNGKVILRGEFDGNRANQSVRNLKDGVYTLCIIDGEDMIEKQFKLG